MGVQTVSRSSDTLGSQIPLTAPRQRSIPALVMFVSGYAGRNSPRIPRTRFRVRPRRSPSQFNHHLSKKQYDINGSKNTHKAPSCRVVSSPTLTIAERTLQWPFRLLQALPLGLLSENYQPPLSTCDCYVAMLAPALFALTINSASSLSIAHASAINNSSSRP